MSVELPGIQTVPSRQRPPQDNPERRRLVTRARLLARAGLAWHAIEAAVAIAAGAIAGSIVLIAFGADSLVEALAGIIVLWRFAVARVDAEHAERRAQQLISITSWPLAGYVTVDATVTLATGDDHATSTAGIGLAIVTLIAMPLLANAKADDRRGARLWAIGKAQRNGHTAGFGRSLCRQLDRGTRGGGRTKAIPVLNSGCQRGRRSALGSKAEPRSDSKAI